MLENDEMNLKVSLTERILEKFNEAASGIPIPFDPDEAEYAGAFVEGALSEKDALESQANSLEIEEGLNDAY